MLILTLDSMKMKSTFFVAYISCRLYLPLNYIYYDTISILVFSLILPSVPVFSLRKTGAFYEHESNIGTTNAIFIAVQKDEDDNGMETKRNEVMPKHDCLLR